MDDAYRSTLLPPTTGNLQVASRPRPSRWPRQSALRSIVRKQINGHYTGHCCALEFVNLPINLEAGWFTNGECPSQKTTREHLLAPMMNELESNSQMIFILICTTGRLMESPNLSSTVVQPRESSLRPSSLQLQRNVNCSCTSAQTSLPSSDSDSQSRTCWDLALAHHLRSR